MRNLLISLDNRYYKEILRGSKLYEFRRTFVSEPTLTFIYVNAPVSEISLCIRTASPIVGDGISMHEYALKNLGEDLEDYFLTATKAYIIPIEQVIKIHPVGLQFLKAKFNFYPPQSYIDLDNNVELYKYLSARFIL